MSDHVGIVLGAVAGATRQKREAKHIASKKEKSDENYLEITKKKYQKISRSNKKRTFSAMCQDTESTWTNQWFFYTPIKSTEGNHEQTPIHKSLKKI